MISIKSSREIDLMRRAGDILARCFLAIEPLIVDGTRASDIDKLAREFFKREGAIPSFLGVECAYRGGKPYPSSVCVSINEEVIHGIPGQRLIKDGDIVGLDMGVIYKGYHSDMARTFCAGTVSEQGLRLVSAAEEAFRAGALAAVPDSRVSDISRAVQSKSESLGFSVVRDYTGHGIGRELHESPQIPNFCDGSAHGARLRSGMTLAIEPMLCAGSYEVDVLDDKWTVVTRDRSLSSHYENTILVCETGYEVLSKPV